MASRFRPAIDEFRRQMRRQVRLPIVGRRVSVSTLGVGLGIVVIGVAAIVGIEVSNQPLFCTSCHEMKVHYRTWALSSHRGVTCEECHVMPGMTNMLRTKFASVRQIYLHQRGNVKASAIQAQVPDANCQRCHAKTRDLIVYHSLKITHQKHWDREIACTLCHDRVAHGPKYLLEGGEAEHRAPLPRVAYKFTPTMQTCYKCHDGKQAPNTCSTCHVVLGERRATAFNPEWVSAHKEDVAQHGKDCRSCHQDDFCTNCHVAANPHPANWTAVHAREFNRSPQRCRTCHQTPGEAQTGAEMRFCYSCHSLRRQHEGVDWMARHQEAFRQNPATCEQCHTKAWCSDCHQISQAHPPDWLRTHPRAANARPENCRTCHAQYFCIACHQGTGKSSIPQSHSRSDWGRNHQAAVASDPKSCRTCHEPGFCRSCHEKKRPASHERGWLKLHGARSAASLDSCLVCHRQSDCNSCHGGLTMPHPNNWVHTHKDRAAKNQQVCSRCHSEAYCTGCHRGARPLSHQQKNWLQSHGQAAREKKLNWQSCHTEQLCQACHGLPMPHPAGWRPGGHTQVAQKSPATCSRCHASDFCGNCHRLPMPHPPDWTAGHGAAAPKQAAACAQCHTASRNQCRTCHAGNPPPSHAAARWKEQHAAAGKDNLALCDSCHGTKSCDTCHGLALPHPTNWAMEHKSQASFAANSVCRRCHANDFCSQCHTR